MIAATHLLDGLPDHRKPPDNQYNTGMDRRLNRQLKNSRIEEPNFTKDKATPLGIIHIIVAVDATSYESETHNVADLFQLGF